MGWWVGPVLAEPDRVVGPRVDDLGSSESAASRTGRAHVVGEHEERAADGADAAVGGHAVHDRAHGVLADAEVDLAAVGGR